MSITRQSVLRCRDGIDHTANFHLGLNLGRFSPGESYPGPSVQRHSIYHHLLLKEMADASPVMKRHESEEGELCRADGALQLSQLNKQRQRCSGGLGTTARRPAAALYHDQVVEEEDFSLVRRLLLGLVDVGHLEEPTAAHQPSVRDGEDLWGGGGKKTAVYTL